MFRETRRPDKQLTMEENIDILKRGEYGVLSTICDNGYPYGIHLNYVYNNNAIYFHGALEGQKYDNIKNNNKVSFAVAVDVELLPSKFDTKYKSVVIFGRAMEVEMEESKDALLAIIEKYSKEYLEQGQRYIEGSGHKTRVIKIEIEHITGKAEK